MGEYVQPHSPLNLDTEEGPEEHSAHDKSASEEMCDEEEEEEQSQEHSAHDKSVFGEMGDGEEEAEKSQEDSVPSQNTLEEIHDEEEVEEEAAQEIAEQTRVSTPEKPDQQNIEEVFQAGNMEIGKGKGTIPKEKNPSPRKVIVVPSKKLNKIKKL